MEIVFKQSCSSYIIWSGQQIVAQSRVLSLGMDLTEKKIKKRIYRFIRPLLRPATVDLKGNEDEERLLELEYQHLFETSQDEEPVYKV